MTNTGVSPSKNNPKHHTAPRDAGGLPTQPEKPRRRVVFLDSQMKPNAVELRGGVAYITLTQGKHAVVDIADYPLVAGHRWCAHKDRRRYYACTHIRTVEGKRATLKMHQLLLSDAEQVDHIDHDGCNNTRANMRECTRSQNLRNGRSHMDGSSRFKGVCWFKRKQKWQAHIWVNGAQIYLGLFASELAAAHAYDEAARKYYGEFACLNFPAGVGDRA